MSSEILLSSDLINNIYSLSGNDIKYGLGRVLQIQNYVCYTLSSQTIATTDTPVSDIAVTITAKRRNSSFKVMARWFGEDNEPWNTVFNITMNGVRVNTPNTRGYGLAMPMQSYFDINDSSTPETASFHTIVKTTVEAGTRLTFVLVADSNISGTMWTNRTFTTGATSNYETGSSEITVMEIGD